MKYKLTGREVLAEKFNFFFSIELGQRVVKIVFFPAVTLSESRCAVQLSQAAEVAVAHRASLAKCSSSIFLLGM